VPFVVDRIVQQGRAANRKRWFFPTDASLLPDVADARTLSVERADSSGALHVSRAQLTRQAGLRLAEVDQFPQLDVTIDGADEVDDDLSASSEGRGGADSLFDCIKGGGACHLREKVRAQPTDHEGSGDGGHVASRHSFAVAGPC